MIKNDIVVSESSCFAITGIYRRNPELNSKSDWRERGRKWLYGSSSLFSDQARQLSRDIISQEWKNISSEAVRPFTYTLPLTDYVPSKGGQPIRVMVRNNHNRKI